MTYHFIEGVLDGGSYYTATRSEDGGFSISPLDGSEQALKDFAPIADKVIGHDGEGYELRPEPHIYKGYQIDYVDLIVGQLVA